MVTFVDISIRGFMPFIVFVWLILFVSIGVLRFPTLTITVVAQDQNREYTSIMNNKRINEIEKLKIASQDEEDIKERENIQKVANRQHSLIMHENHFPSIHEEYDPFIFDPHSLFGAPYGGYARATRSRLAALPLRFVGTVGFELDQLAVDGTVTHDIVHNMVSLNIGNWNNRQGEEDVSKNSPSASLKNKAEAKRLVSDFSAPTEFLPYFSIRDGDGRKFECKVYNENELENYSINDSVFDVAIERRNVITYESLYEERENLNDGTEEKVCTDFQTSFPLDYNHLHGNMVNSIHSESRKETTHLMGNKTPYPNNMNNNSPKIINSSDIQRQLLKLSGMCSELHLDWWSYQWCHERGVTQFHIDEIRSHSRDVKGEKSTNVEEYVSNNYNNKRLSKNSNRGNDVPAVTREGDISLTKSINYQIEDSISVGMYMKRKISVNTKAVPEPNPNDSEGRVFSGLINVVDIFDDGEWCHEAGSYRSVIVILRCCTDDELADNMIWLNKYKESDEYVKKTFALLHKVEESKEDICKYSALVCTNVLCNYSFLEEMKELSGEQKHHPDMPLTSEESTRIVPISSLHSFSGLSGKKKNSIMTNKISIRYILEVSLGKKCLERNEGWWTYLFCHKSHISQFHEITFRDMNSGTMKMKIDQEYKLGLYNEEKLDGFSIDKEIKYVVQQQDDNVSSNQFSVEKSRTSLDISDTGDMSPHYVQEYSDGDVCADKDTTLSIQRGSFSGEKIERSTTVRFFCGNDRDIVRVNEDSSCHYVMDITVPELCSHKYFKVPLLTTQIVKCI